MATSPYSNDDGGRDGYFSEFDAQRTALARRRRLAQMLQQQSMERSSNIVNPATGGRSSWLAPIAQMFQAYAGAKMGNAADAESRTNAAAEQQAMEEAIANAPQGTPSVPARWEETAPAGQRMPMLPTPPTNFGPAPGSQNTLGGQLSGPAAPQGGLLPQLPTQMPPAAPPAAPAEPAGMEPVPAQEQYIPGQPAQPPTAEDLLGYGSRLARFGNPVASKIADRALGRGLDKMFPQPPSEESIARIAEVQANREASIASRADALAQRAESARMRSEDARLSIEQRREAAADRSAAMREIAQIRADAASDKSSAAGKLLPTSESSENGNKLYRNSAGEQFEIVNGKPKPYGGDTINTNALEKEVPVVRAIDQGLKSGERLLKQVGETPDAFGPTTALSRLPLVGGVIRKTMYTPEEMKAQASVSKDAAEVINRLYGAALSMREDERAKSFIPGEGDPPELLKSKLTAALAWAREKREQQSSAARTTAERRRGGSGTTGAWDAAPAGGGGWGKAVRE
jgi:hypothetical protein